MYSTEEIAEVGFDQFETFLEALWKWLDLRDTRGNPSPPTDVQRDIARWLQHGPRRQITMAFRGVGKSWITAAYVLWRLLLNPNLKIMVVSANADRANDFATFVNFLLHEVPWLEHLAPSREGRQRITAFDVGGIAPDQSPSVKAVGITGQLTGGRADIIVADDIEVPKNSLTHLLRERLQSLVREFDAVLKPGGQVIYLGTPQNEATIYNVLRERGYEARIWPAEVPERLEPYGDDLAPFIQQLIQEGNAPGTPTDPRRFNDQDLSERKLSYGKVEYFLQFMLDTTARSHDTNPLKLRDLVVESLDLDSHYLWTAWSGEITSRLKDVISYGLPGDFFHGPVPRVTDEHLATAPYQMTVMAIDPSGGGKDETAYAIVRHLAGRLFLVASGGYISGFSPGTLESLAKVAAKHKVNEVIIEKNFGDGMFFSLFQPVLRKYCAAAMDPDRQYRVSSQKETRIIDGLLPLLEQHRLTVDRAVVERDFEQAQLDRQYSLFHQLTRITRDKGSLPHEDRLEALWAACNFFAEVMKVDSDIALKRHDEKAWKKEIETWQQHTLGARFKKRNRRGQPLVRSRRR